MTRRLINAGATAAIFAAICDETGVSFRNTLIICFAIGALLAIPTDRKDKQ